MNPSFVSNPSLHPTEKGNRPFAVLHVDLSGDLATNTTTKKNRYFLNIVCSFSKWCDIYPLPDRASATTADRMWDFVKRFGPPVKVIADKGTEFEGEFKQLLEDMRV